MEDHLSTDTVELIVYLRVLWRQKLIIALTFLAAIITVWLISDVPDAQFRVSTSLLILPPLASELNVNTSNAVLAPEAYKQLALSTKILQSVMNQEPLASAVETQTIEDLRTNMSLDVSTMNSFALGGDGANARQILLTFSIKGHDPELLVSICRVWAQAFSDTLGSLFQDRTALSYEYIRQNAEETDEELQAMLADRQELLLRTPISSLRSYHALLQSRLDSICYRLSAARQSLITSQSFLAGLEKEIALQPETLVLTHAISPDSLVAVSSDLSVREIEALASIQVQREEVNTTYVGLDATIANVRAGLQELEAKIQYLEQDEQETIQLLGATNRELVEAEAQLADLNRNIALLEFSTEVLSARLLTARIALGDTLTPIQVIDEPFTPKYPIGARTKSNVLVAGFLGLMLGTLLAFFVDYLQRVKEREATILLEREESLQELGGKDTCEKS